MTTNLQNSTPNRNYVHTSHVLQIIPYSNYLLILLAYMYMYMYIHDYIMTGYSIIMLRRKMAGLGRPWLNSPGRSS